MATRLRLKPRTRPTKQQLYAEIHRLRAEVKVLESEAHAIGADRVLLKHMSVMAFLRWRRKP